MVGHALHINNEPHSNVNHTAVYAYRMNRHCAVISEIYYLFGFDIILNSDCFPILNNMFEMLHIY